MPLEFESLSHGRIVFGFFNIETDMLLLNQDFFFASDFCQGMIRATKKTDPLYQTAWEGYRIPFEDIGNLMGAIHGIDFRGFIGEVYQHFPFPKRQEDFKQKPEGHRTRPVIESLIQKYGDRISLPLVLDQTKNHTILGDCLFDKPSFWRLIEYVWLGGLPRWRDRIRPDYVNAMKEAIESAHHPMLKGLLLIEKESSFS